MKPDIFKNFNEQIKVNKDAWKKIDVLCETLKQSMENKFDNTPYNTVQEQLLLLLVEQIRPISCVGEQAEKLEADLSGIINSIKAVGKK